MCHGIKLTTNVFCFQDFLSHVIRRCTHVFDKTLDKIFQLNSNSIWRTLHLRFRQIIGFEVWELQNILNTWLSRNSSFTSPRFTPIRRVSNYFSAVAAGLPYDL